MAKYLSEKLDDVMVAAREYAKREVDQRPETADLSIELQARKMIERLPDVGRKFEYFLNTGNMVTKTGLDLQQTSGFTIVAEKLNFFRYLSHFRCVHRGAYFAEIRTTTVRKLLPESYGFMCPVHTPDGAPCGLLLHLTAACLVDAVGPPDPAMARSAIVSVLVGGGMLAAQPALILPSMPAYLPVHVDGRLVGALASTGVEAVVARLRRIKAAVHEINIRGSNTLSEGSGGGSSGIGNMSHLERHIPANTEIAVIPYRR